MILLLTVLILIHCYAAQYQGNAYTNLQTPWGHQSLKAVQPGVRSFNANAAQLWGQPIQARQPGVRTADLFAVAIQERYGGEKSMAEHRWEYFLSKPGDRATYTEAKAICQRKGFAGLVDIPNASHMKAFHADVFAQKTATYVGVVQRRVSVSDAIRFDWVSDLDQSPFGLFKRNKGGTWIFSGGPARLKWFGKLGGRQQPGDESESETCLAFAGRDLRLHDVPCTLKFNYICGSLKVSEGSAPPPSGNVVRPSKDLQCGRPNTWPVLSANLRIVGGREADRCSWPWQALFKHKGFQSCGGAILNDRYIISAAHCFFTRRRLSDWEVILGEHNETKKEGTEIYRKIKRIVIHERYMRSPLLETRNDNDIALVELDKPTVLTRCIQPVCLPNATALPNTNRCYVTGFGTTKGTGGDDVLKQAGVPIWTDAECHSIPDIGTRLTTNMMCAGFKEGGHDSCQGDSGGPLVCMVGNEHSGGFWQINGLVSWGIGCAGKNAPGVYARVFNYIDWIYANMV